MYPYRDAQRAIRNNELTIGLRTKLRFDEEQYGALIEALRKLQSEPKKRDVPR